MEHLKAEVDVNAIQQKVNEYALEGALKAVKDYYTGYSSPYIKAIEKSLEGKAVDHMFELPDILGVINEQLTKEIDKIANTAVAKTFVPLISKILTREDREIKFSDILEKFISTTEFKDNDFYWDDYSVEVIKESASSFIYFKISNGETTYELHLMRKSKDGVEPKVYEAYTLPYLIAGDGYNKFSTTASRTMKVSFDGGATLEMPFTKGVLEDEFVSYIARLILGGNQIIFNTDNFNEGMFPERDQCHC